ncbi:hypothetical protein BCV69DRAFT_292374 [Microstroma glucosiphilum]|uniref:PH domain-containing protein n=1 Tax=Pseudomicrostroma glucosiphilum TaxID=1684307 RepID=A0A316UCT1_9BASI|nr:hypothetical protein BCV69DRAFT_292374 [Pseudomicrostroma glucosiphilum]PWN23006.1 hypothetical protein BCV69DRAFT_292374 [Pseudomicrostroma glucosiphilum]
MADGYESPYRVPVPHHRQLPYHLQQEQQRRQLDQRHLQLQQQQQQQIQYSSLKTYQERQPQELFLNQETASTFSQSQRASPLLLRLDDGSDADMMGKGFMNMSMFARQPPKRAAPPPPPRAPPSPPAPTSPARLSQSVDQVPPPPNVADLIQSSQRSSVPKSPPRVPRQESILVSSPSPEVAQLHAGSSSSTSSRPTSASLGYERSDGPGSSDTEASLLYGQTSDTEPEVGPFTPKTPSTPALALPTTTSTTTATREPVWKPKELRLVDRQREASTSAEPDGASSFLSAKERRRKASEAKPPFKPIAAADSIGLGIEFADPSSSHSSVTSSTPDQSVIADPNSRKHALKPLNLAGGSPSPVPGSSPMFSSLSAGSAAASYSPRFPSSPRQGLGLAPSLDHVDRPRRPSREGGLSDEGRNGRWSPLLILPRSPAFASVSFGNANATSSFDRPRATSIATSADAEQSLNVTPAASRKSSLTPSPQSIRQQPLTSQDAGSVTQDALNSAANAPSESNRMLAASISASPEASVAGEGQAEASSSKRRLPPPSLVLRSPTSPLDSQESLSASSSASSSLPAVTPTDFSPAAGVCEDRLSPPTSRQRQDSLTLLPPTRDDGSPLSSPALSTYHDSLTSPVKERREVSSTPTISQDENQAEQEDQSDESAKTPRLSVAAFEAVPDDEPPPTPYFEVEVEPAAYGEGDAGDVSSPSDYGEEPSYLPNMESSELTSSYLSESQDVKEQGSIGNKEFLEHSSESDDLDGSYENSRPGIPLIFRQMLRESTPQATGWESYSLTAIESSNSMSSLASAEEILRFASESEGNSPAPSQGDASPFQFDLSPSSELAAASSMPFDLSSAASDFALSSAPSDQNLSAEHGAFEFDRDEAAAEPEIDEPTDVADEDEGDETPVIVQTQLAFTANEQVPSAASPDDDASERSSLPSDPSFAEALNQALSSFDGSDSTPTSIYVNRAPAEDMNSVRPAERGAVARSSVLMFAAPPLRSESSGALLGVSEQQPSAAIVSKEEGDNDPEFDIGPASATQSVALGEAVNSLYAPVTEQEVTPASSVAEPDSPMKGAASIEGIEKIQIDQLPSEGQAEAHKLDEADCDRPGNVSPPRRPERLTSLLLRCDSPEAMQDGEGLPNAAENGPDAEQALEAISEDVPEPHVQRMEEKSSLDRSPPTFDTGIFVQRGRAESLSSKPNEFQSEERTALAESPKSFRKEIRRESQDVPVVPPGAGIASARLSARGVGIIALSGLPGTGAGALPTLALRSVEQRRPNRSNRPNLRVDTASPPVPESFEDRQLRGRPEARKTSSGEESSRVPESPAMSQSLKPLPPTPTAAGFDIAPLRTNVMPRSAPLPQGPFAGAALRRPEADMAYARQPASHWSSGSESEDDSSKRLSAKKRRSGSTRKRSSSAAPPSNRASFAAQANMANQPLPSPSIVTRKGLLQVLRKKSFNNLGLASAERDGTRESSPLTPGLDSPALPRVSTAADGFPFPGMTAGKSPFALSGNADSTVTSSLSTRPSLAVRSHSKQVSSISLMRGPSLMHKQSSSSLRTEISSSNTGGGAASNSMPDREAKSLESTVSPPASPRKARNSSTFPPPLPVPTRGRSKSFTAPQSLLTLQRIGSQGLPPLPAQPQSPGLKDFSQLKHVSLNSNQLDLATRARSASTAGTSPPTSRSSKLFSKTAGSGIISRKLSRSSLSSQAAMDEPPLPSSDLRPQALEREKHGSFKGLTPLAEANGTPNSAEGDTITVMPDRPVLAEVTDAKSAQDGSPSAPRPEVITTPKKSSAVRRGSQASGAGSSPERIRADPLVFSLDNGANPMSPQNMQALLAMASSPDALQSTRIARDLVAHVSRHKSRHIVKQRKLQRLERTQEVVPHYPSLTELGSLWQAEHPSERMILADAMPMSSASMGAGGISGSSGSRADHTDGKPSGSGDRWTEGRQDTGRDGNGKGLSGAGPPGGGGDEPNGWSQDDDIAADQVSSSEESEDDYGEDKAAADDSDDSDDVPLGVRMGDVASLQRRLTHQTRQQPARALQSSSNARAANLETPGSAVVSPDDLFDRLRQIQLRQTDHKEDAAARTRTESRHTTALPSLGSVVSGRPTTEVDSDKAEKIRRARSLANRHRPSAVSTANTPVLPLTSPTRPYGRDSTATQSELGRNSTAASSLAALKSRTSVSESHAAAAMRASLAATSNPAMAAAAVAFATKEAQAGRIAMSEIPERATAIALENTLSGGVTPGSIKRSKSLASKGASTSPSSHNSHRDTATSLRPAEAPAHSEPVQQVTTGSRDLAEIATGEATVRRGSSTRQRPAGVDLRLGTTLLPSMSSPPPSSAPVSTLSPPTSAASDGRSQSAATSRAPTRANSVARPSRGMLRSSIDQATLPTVPKVQRTIFIINRQKFVQFQVALDARARDVVIDVLNREALQAVPGRGGWALFEVSPSLGTERPLREYEYIDVVAEAGADPSQDFLLLKQTELTPSLSLRAVPAYSPTLAGYVYIRDRRLKWSKRWLELRDHSLFHYKSEKGKEETLLCHLSSFDIYLVDASSASSSLKAPKAHSFALRIQRSRSARVEPDQEEEQVYYCSLSDPSAHRDWVKACLSARTYVLRQEQPQLFQLPALPPSSSVEETQGGHNGGHERSGVAPLIQRDTNREGQPAASAYLGKEQASLLSRGAIASSGPFEKGSLLAAQAMKDQSGQQGQQQQQKGRWPRAGAALDQMHRLTKSPPM